VERGELSGTGSVIRHFAAVACTQLRQDAIHAVIVEAHRTVRVEEVAAAAVRAPKVKTEMMAITTSNSIRVKPLAFWNDSWCWTSLGGRADRKPADETNESNEAARGVSASPDENIRRMIPEIEQVTQVIELASSLSLYCRDLAKQMKNLKCVVATTSAAAEDWTLDQREERSSTSTSLLSSIVTLNIGWGDVGIINQREDRSALLITRSFAI
jgi:hypothetical protein